MASAGHATADVVALPEVTATNEACGKTALGPLRDYVIRAFNRDILIPNSFWNNWQATPLESRLSDQSRHRFSSSPGRMTLSAMDVDGMLQQRMDDLDDIVANTAAS